MSDLEWGKAGNVAMAKFGSSSQVREFLILKFRENFLF
jgi:hypothetical protein